MATTLDGKVRFTWNGPAIEDKVTRAVDRANRRTAGMGAMEMRRRVHVITGRLFLSIYSRKRTLKVGGISYVFGATAPYALFEAGRGGPHDFWTPAIELATRSFPGILRDEMRFAR